MVRTSGGCVVRRGAELDDGDPPPGPVLIASEWTVGGDQQWPTPRGFLLGEVARQVAAALCLAGHVDVWLGAEIEVSTGLGVVAGDEAAM
jgi:hypothetical protein